MANRHVVPNPNGGWDVKIEGQSRPESHHSTQSEAEQAAKAAARRTGGGEVVIHRPDGTIRDKDTIAPARDPNPPRDKKH